MQNKYLIHPLFCHSGSLPGPGSGKICRNSKLMFSKWVNAAGARSEVVSVHKGVNSLHKSYLFSWMAVGVLRERGWWRHSVPFLMIHNRVGLPESLSFRGSGVETVEVRRCLVCGVNGWVGEQQLRPALFP